MGVTSVLAASLLLNVATVSLAFTRPPALPVRPGAAQPHARRIHRCNAERERVTPADAHVDDKTYGAPEAVAQSRREALTTIAALTTLTFAASSAIAPQPAEAASAAVRCACLPARPPARLPAFHATPRHATPYRNPTTSNPPTPSVSQLPRRTSGRSLPRQPSVRWGAARRARRRRWRRSRA